MWLTKKKVVNNSSRVTEALYQCRYTLILQVTGLSLLGFCRTSAFHIADSVCVLQENFCFCSKRETFSQFRKIFFVFYFCCHLYILVHSQKWLSDIDWIVLSSRSGQSVPTLAVRTRSRWCFGAGNRRSVGRPLQPGGSGGGHLFPGKLWPRWPTQACSLSAQLQPPSHQPVLNFLLPPALFGEDEPCYLVVIMQIPKHLDKSSMCCQGKACNTLTSLYESVFLVQKFTTIDHSVLWLVVLYVTADRFEVSFKC